MLQELSNKHMGARRLNTANQQLSKKAAAFFLQNHRGGYPNGTAIIRPQQSWSKTVGNLFCNFLRGEGRKKLKAGVTPANHRIAPGPCEN